MKYQYVLKQWANVSLFFLLSFFMISVKAHEARPISIEIKAYSANHYQLTWRIPASVPMGRMPYLILPQSCKMSQPLIKAMYKDALVQNGQFDCTKALSGTTLSLKFPSGNPSLSTLIRIVYLSGETQSHILKPGELQWVISEQESWQQTVIDYIQLGVIHIWKGVDHLLFVACLLYIAKTRRRIIITITGFTVAHSITLVLATLRWVNMPIPLVEAIIALSIIFLAVEIANEINAKFKKLMNEKNTATWSWTFKYPIIVASAFGLLHGFGFSAVLQEIGLPQTELPLALLCFNIGVEIGQLSFILLLVILFKQVILPIKSSLLSDGLLVKKLPIFLIYFIGSVASFWFYQRLTVF